MTPPANLSGISLEMTTSNTASANRDVITFKDEATVAHNSPPV